MPTYYSDISPTPLSISDSKRKVDRSKVKEMVMQSKTISSHLQAMIANWINHPSGRNGKL